MRLGLSVGIVGAIVAWAAPSLAGTVAGKLELPPSTERPPVISRGFLDRMENPLAEVKKLNLAPYFVVALEGDAPVGTPGEVTWDLVGESFSRPVIAVPVGAEVVIRNQTKVSRTLGAAEDAKLIAGPLNPTGSKSFRATQPAIYTVRDKDAPHLRGKIVVVATRYTSVVDDAGRFELADVPDGNYKLRIFYYNAAAEARGGSSGWLPTTTDVAVSSKKAGRTEVNAKVTAAELAPAPPAGAAPGKK